MMKTKEGQDGLELFDVTSASCSTIHCHNNPTFQILDSF